MDKHPTLHLGVVAIEKGAFRSPLTKVSNLFLFKNNNNNNHLFAQWGDISYMSHIVPLDKQWRTCR